MTPATSGTGPQTHSAAGSAPVTPEAVRDTMYTNDHATRMLGIEIIAIGSGSATATMTVRPDMVNGHGVCHGGAIFFLADSTFGYACNSSNVEALAVSGHIDFLSAANLGDRLVATAVEQWSGGRTGLTDVTVRVSNGEGSEETSERVVAIFRGRSTRLGRPVVTP